MVFWVEMNLLVERSQWAMMHGDLAGGLCLRCSDVFLCGGAVTNWGSLNGPLYRNGVEKPRDAAGARWMDTSVICCRNVAKGGCRDEVVSVPGASWEVSRAERGSKRARFGYTGKGSCRQ